MPSPKPNSSPGRRRAKVAECYVRGLSLWEIARSLRLDEAVVCAELAEIRQQWLKDSDLGLKEAKARELAKLDRLEAELWRAWKRSQRTIVRVKTIEKDAVPVAKETVREGQAGDARFLASVEGVIERRSAILGIEMAKKSADEAGVVTLSTLLDEIEAEKTRGSIGGRS